jgi:predicted kinase
MGRANLACETVLPGGQRRGVERMPRLHLIEGPVGAGKSTFAKELALRGDGIHVALDEWFARLFSPDKPATDFVPWYIERKQRLIELILSHARAILASGKDAVLELGLIQRQARVEFCERVLEEGIDLAVCVLDAPRDVRRRRVQRRNADRGPTFSMLVPDAVFEMASNLWEPPDEIERSRFSIQFLASEPNDGPREAPTRQHLNDGFKPHPRGRQQRQQRSRVTR